VVNLRWLKVIVKEDLRGMGGRFKVIFPSLEEIHLDDMGDLSEINATGYELMNDDGRIKIDELLEAGLTLGSAAVAGSVLSVLQRNGKERTLFAIGTLGRGQLLKKLHDMKLIKAIRNKRDEGGRNEGPLRADPSRPFVKKTRKASRGPSAPPWGETCPRAPPR
jgi:hypothetical protein